MANFNEELNNKPFKDYSEYMQYVFDCVNSSINSYIAHLKVIYANGDGGYKNIMYPDIELAEATCHSRLTESYKGKNIKMYK